MVFFLALLPERNVTDFLAWAEQHLKAQSGQFQNRFRPAVSGLALAAAGTAIDRESGGRDGARRFLGWSKERHWLLA
jgi:hypothetical protein